MEEKKKPTMLGFKPSDEEYQMVLDLIEHYNKAIKVKGFEMNNSQILRMALEHFHKEKFKEKVKKK